MCISYIIQRQCRFIKWLGINHLGELRRITNDITLTFESYATHNWVKHLAASGRSLDHIFCKKFLHFSHMHYSTQPSMAASDFYRETNGE